MKCLRIFWAISAILLSVGTVHSQSSRLDTVYTPIGFPLGNLMATIGVPSHPNGVGILLAHGASGVPYTRGDFATWCDTLAANGYLAMAFDYYSFSFDTVLDTNACYPLQARTFKTAVEFLRRNAVRFNVDPQKIVGLGVSAGSVHWGQCLPWANDDAFFHTDPSIDDGINAAVLMYGYYEYTHLPMWIKTDILMNHFALFPDLQNTKASCMANLDKINIPILLIHGKLDAVVPVEQSVAFFDSLHAHGKNAQLILVDSADHGFDTEWTPPCNFTPMGLQAKDSVLAFLHRTFLSSPDAVTAKGQLPSEPRLEQNYPNPFNPTTNIRYTVEGTRSQGSGVSDVRLVVYDLLGREVAVLVNDKRAAGTYEVQFDGARLASGMYFCRLTAGTYTATKAMVLTR